MLPPSRPAAPSCRPVRARSRPARQLDTRSSCARPASSISCTISVGVNTLRTTSSLSSSATSSRMRCRTRPTRAPPTGAGQRRRQPVGQPSPAVKPRGEPSAASSTAARSASRTVSVCGIRVSCTLPYSSTERSTVSQMKWPIPGGAPRSRLRSHRPAAGVAGATAATSPAPPAGSGPAAIRAPPPSPRTLLLCQPPDRLPREEPTAPAPSSAQAAATGRLCVTNPPARPPSTAPIATSGQTISRERRPAPENSSCHPYRPSRRRSQPLLHRLARAMAFTDLRDWIDHLRREGELHEVTAQVDPHLEIIGDHRSRDQAPAARRCCSATSGAATCRS